ncbi:unnamed protein product [Brugia timori]|uniref:Uncharacterized protein n=1 Tax=Brugia timori TaxID=42155 RepID=A0A0R3QRX8_9BILA|nr:unnamed protein product [Brugia timori]
MFYILDDLDNLCIVRISFSSYFLWVWVVALLPYLHFQKRSVIS